MAAFAFTDAVVVINGTDLSDHVKKVTLKTQAAELESTAMGATYRSRLGGLKDFVADVEFNQDFAAAKVDATLFPLLGTVVTFTLKPTSAASSATNPTYSGSVLVKELPVLANAVGDLAVISVSWPSSGVLNRFTT